MSDLTRTKPYDLATCVSTLLDTLERARERKPINPDIIAWAQGELQCISKEISRRAAPTPP